MRGKGRIFRRGGRWWIAYYGPVRGRTDQIREAGGDTREEAERALARRLTEVRLHREGARQFAGPAAGKLTVRKVVDSYLEDAEVRGLRSLRTMTAHSKHLIHEIGATRATLLSSETTARYIRERKRQKAAAATINRELELLRAAVKHAHADGLIAWVPPIRTLGARQETVRSGFLDREEMARLIAAIRDEDLRDFVAFFSLTAMRPGEIASLRWADLDEKAGVLRLAGAGAKIGEARVLPVVPEIAAILGRRKARRRPGVATIFHNGGQPATRRNGGLSKGWYAEWSRALERAGLPASTLLYDLRRSAIRALRDAGVPERTIMAISGHKTRSTFDRYSIVTTSDMAEALRSVEGYAAPREGGQVGDKRGRKP